MMDERRIICERGRGSPAPYDIALLAVCVLTVVGALDGAPAAAQENMSWPGSPPYPVFREDRVGNPPETPWQVSDAGAPLEYPYASPGGPVRAMPWPGAETAQPPAMSGFSLSPGGLGLGGTSGEPWTWQCLPDGVIYPSYLAGPKEPRMASAWNHDAHHGWMWDLEAGGRVGLLRYGTPGSPRPDGWELDLEGAAFPRLDLDHDEDLISVDFRAGIPLTFGYGPFRTKLEVYHLSSHLGDEYIQRFGDSSRVNYSRNAVVLGGSYYPTNDLRLYAEAEWAFYTDGGTKPWEFQFGFDYSPVRSFGCCGGAPFVAVNGQIREEVDYNGSLVAQAGWQWRGASNHLFRIGAQYFTGKSDQYQFYRRNEEKVGVAIWYDF